MADAILYWNSVALEANRVSHTNGKNEQTGPPLSARALAIVHLAMYDAYAGILRQPAVLPPYFANPLAPPAGAVGLPALAAAVAAAAHATLSRLFPSQKPAFDLAHANAGLLGAGIQEAHQYGLAVAQQLLNERKNDPGAGDDGYAASMARGAHRPDPDHPDQGFHAPFYGANSKCFAVTQRHQLLPPPAIGSLPYQRALTEVRGKGIAPELIATLGMGFVSRTPDESLIGIFWAYDGASGLGTPPRFYNQIVRKVAEARGNTEVQNARLFALVNAALADAGILAWDEKYRHDFWRPVLGVRENDVSLGPTAQAAGPVLQSSDPFWLPFGAPKSNVLGKNFTPPFPAYPSGHATFGAAAFQSVRRFYGIAGARPDELTSSLAFISDELNGITTDNAGTVRPRHARSFAGGLWQMIEENGRSRVFLGVHWIFDAFSTDADGKPDFNTNIGGVPLGIRIADDIADNGLKQSLVGPRLELLATDPTTSRMRAAGRCESQPIRGVAAPVAGQTRFQRVIAILDEAIGGPNVGIGAHGAFWRGLTRDQFVAKRVFGRVLVVVGSGAASNLVKALKGEAPFGSDLPNPPPNAELPRMPAGFPPVADPDIAFIEGWINDGCPEDEFVERALTWRPTNAPVASSRTDDIWFINPDVGWAVNSNGQIVHTTDGGASWIEQLHDESVYFRCIGFASPTRGWAGTLTRSKRMFQTSDGGATWTQVANLPPLAPSAVCGLSVVNEWVAYASGTNYPDRPARMMKTVDGGATWAAWEMAPHASLLVDTFFSSPERGWVVGGRAEPGVPSGPGRDRANIKPVVLYTEDGGQSWVDRLAAIRGQLPLGEWGWKIQFLNEQVGFVSLESFTAGAILKTTDGGQTWARLTINDPQGNANLEGVGFLDERQGWVGGWGSGDFTQGFSSATSDGGATWQDANDIGRFINRFRFFGNPVTVGYASGRTVYKYSAEPAVAGLIAAAAPAGGAAQLQSVEPQQGAGRADIRVRVPAGAQRLMIRIWDRFGEQVRFLADEQSPQPGARTFGWDLTDERHRPLPAGDFIVRVTVDNQSESQIFSTERSAV